MQVNVRAVNCKVGDNVRDYTREKISHVGRLFDHLTAADVEFREQRNPRVAEKEEVEVTLSTSAGTLIRARAHAADPFSAVDLVVARLERQVRRLKERLVARSHPREARAAALNSRQTEKDDESDKIPRIVRTKRFDMKPMTAEEAALQMDLLGHGFYFFTNSETAEPNVVYRRRDGDVGLIEPNR